MPDRDRDNETISKTKRERKRNREIYKQIKEYERERVHY